MTSSMKPSHTPRFSCIFIEVATTETYTLVAIGECHYLHIKHGDSSFDTIALPMLRYEVYK